MNTHKKRILSVGISLILVVGLFCFATAADNLETASTWARNGITDALDKGFVPTEIQNNYTNVITRKEFCLMAIKWVEYAKGEKIDAVLAEKGLSRNPNSFTDTSDPDILAAFALGITSGTGNNQFTPNGQFSREQAATMIMNTCRAIGADVSNPPASGFADMGTASDWAVNGINFVRAKGIMQGTGDNNFSPRANYTREQSIITFNNIDLEKIGISNNNPLIDVGIVGIWILESMELSGATISAEEFENFFPTGMPYFWFNEDNTVNVFNLSFEYDIDSDTYRNVVGFGTYTQNDNSISVIDNEGEVINLSKNGEVLLWQTVGGIMRFRHQWDIGQE